VVGFAADVSNCQQITTTVDMIVKSFPEKRIDILVNCAGISKPLLFEQFSDRDFEQHMAINYLGSVYTTRAALRYMPAGSRIQFVSSLGGLSGIAGMTAYTPTKFALRGLAECLAMELRPRKIFVTVVNPPDVDTPMYAAEMKIKPEETKLISAGSGLFTADKIASDMLGALKRWRFFVQTGMDGHLSGILNIGMAPSGSPLQLMVEALFMGLLRFVSMFYLWNFNSICTKCYSERVNGPATNAQDKKR